MSLAGFQHIINSGSSKISVEQSPDQLQNIFSRANKLVQNI